MAIQIHYPEIKEFQSFCFTDKNFIKFVAFAIEFFACNIYDRRALEGDKGCFPGSLTLNNGMKFEAIDL